jgi:hypothetical protein
LFPLLLVACVNPTPTTDDPSLVGRAEAVVSQVPPSVGCIQITAGTRTVSADTTTGQTVTVQLTQLPLGSTTFSALAFAGGCSGVTSASVADWASAPVVANIAVGQLTQVTLLLEPSGNASVGITFDTNNDLATAPDMATGCVPSKANCIANGQVCGNAPDGCGGTISCGSCGGTCCFDSCQPPHSFCP